MPMDQQILQEFDTHCIQDEPPACQTMCPLHLEARTLVRLMAEGNARDARKIIDRYLPLSGLSGYLCEGPCQAHCRRTELDEGIDLPLLERFCVAETSSVKLMAMPATRKALGILGAGLSSLVLAGEMGRKGHQVTVFHVGPVGGRLAGLPPERLPESALPETLELLGRVRVTFEEWPEYSPAAFEQVRADSLAVFLGFDDPALTPAALGLSPDQVAVAEVTMLTGLENVLARPLMEGEGRFVDDMVAGKKAAGSIDRILQGVPPDTARSAEAVYPTRLYTNLARAEAKPKQRSADPLAPSEAEVRAEAERCLFCECLECVKECAYLRHYKTYPKKNAREIYNTISTAVGNRSSNILALSCAECGLCKEICPGQADMGEFNAAARLDMVAGKHMPISAHEFALEDMAFSNSAEISFFRHQPGQGSSEWLFFPGCQLPTSRPEATAAVYAHLGRHLEGGVGFFMACCGAPARWAGRLLLTGQMAEVVRGGWEQAGRPKVIVACASCALFFQAVLPEIPVSTLWNVLDGLPLPEGPAAADLLALHDPCAARHDSETQKSVRRLAEKLSQPLEEPALGGRMTRCCGYGGLAASANPALGRNFTSDRIKDSERPFLAYCIICRDRLRSQGRPALHLLDLMFPGATTPAEAADRPSPGVSDRQEGRRLFRQDILRTVWGEETPEGLPMDDIVIHITEELAAKLETRRVMRSDIKKVLIEAREKGPLFSHPDTGRHLAGLRPRQVTYWVEYSLRDDGSFEVHDAYCHRMVVPGVPGEGADSVSVQEGYNPQGGRA